NKGQSPLFIRGTMSHPWHALQPEPPQKVYAILIVLLCAFLALKRKLPIFSLPTLIVVGHVVAILGVAYYLLDIWRYLVTPWVITHLTLTLGAKLALEKDSPSLFSAD